MSFWVQRVQKHEVWVFEYKNMKFEFLRFLNTKLIKWKSFAFQRFVIKKVSQKSFVFFQQNIKIINMSRITSETETKKLYLMSKSLMKYMSLSVETSFPCICFKKAFLILFSTDFYRFKLFILRYVSTFLVFTCALFLEGVFITSMV